MRSAVRWRETRWSRRLPLSKDRGGIAGLVGGERADKEVVSCEGCGLEGPPVAGSGQHGGRPRTHGIEIGSCGQKCPQPDEIGSVKTMMLFPRRQQGRQPPGGIQKPEDLVR